MTDIKRITPGSKADLARRMADRRRELIARPLAEIWEELAAVAMDGSDPAPSGNTPSETAAMLGMTEDELSRETAMAAWRTETLVADAMAADTLVQVNDEGKEALDFPRLARVAIAAMPVAPPVRSAASTDEPVAWIAFNANGDRTGLSWDIDDTKYWERRGWTVKPLSCAAPTTSPNPVVAENATTETLPRRVMAEGLGERLNASPDPFATQVKKALDRPPSSEPDAVREALAECYLAGRGFDTPKISDERNAHSPQWAVALSVAGVHMPALSRPAHGGWQDITATSPSEYRKGYLVCRPFQQPIRAYRTAGGDWYMHGESMVRLSGEYEPTHWQDLPEPPPIPRKERQTGEPRS